jgi:hypothetical protein
VSKQVDGQTGGGALQEPSVLQSAALEMIAVGLHACTMNGLCLYRTEPGAQVYEESAYLLNSLIATQPQSHLRHCLRQFDILSR